MMDKKTLLMQIGCVILWLVGIVYVILVSLLVSPVAMHINAFGIVDGVGSALWLLPMGILLIVLAIGLFIYNFAKKDGKNRDILNCYLLALGVFIAIIAWVYYAIAAGGYSLGDELNFSIAMAILIPLGALIILLGNLALRLQPNSWLGFRIGKNLDDPAVWQKTQQIGGLTAMICGAVVILSAIIFGLLGLDIWAMVALIICLIALVCVPLIIMRKDLVFRKDSPDTPSDKNSEEQASK